MDMNQTGSWNNASGQCFLTFQPIRRHFQRRHTQLLVPVVQSDRNLSPSLFFVYFFHSSRRRDNENLWQGEYGRQCRAVTQLGISASNLDGNEQASSVFYDAISPQTGHKPSLWSCLRSGVLGVGPLLQSAVNFPFHSFLETGLKAHLMW